ncbi:MAG: DUF4395 domain-containing protein [Acidimicrobiales bacterium]
MKRILAFPNPVDDAAARTVAAGVVLMCALAWLSGPWWLVPLTYGFLARLASGPTFSPLGQFATRLAAPRLARWRKPVPGPPKRFAQGIGAAFSVATSLVWWSAGWSIARWILVPLMAAASLEAFAGLCLGCTIFGWLIRWRLVPASVCAECGDLTAHFARTRAT